MCRPRALTLVATILMALLGVVCVQHERQAMSGTFDEPNHLAAGLEWWQLGSYSAWTENPPLARVAIAALPYWKGMRFPAALASGLKERGGWLWRVGSELLYGGPGFEVNLGRARLGTLPFCLLVLAAAWGLGAACDPNSWYSPSEVPPEPFAWLRAYAPMTIAGSSIRLYRLPPFE